MNYTYEANNIGGKLWMVKRYKENGLWDESLIESESIAPKEVIQQAIDRGSWA